MDAKYALGLDVAKQTLEVCLLDSSGKVCRTQVLNSHPGFEQLLGWLHGLSPTEVHVCLEPTGKYSREVASFLLQRGFVVSQVNSYAVLSHGRSKRFRSKYDRIDAFLLADYCLKERPLAWVPANKAQGELRDVEARVQNTVEMIQQEKNRLEAGVDNAVVRSDIESHIADLESRKNRLEKLAKQIAQGDQVLSQNLQVLQSIIGIGERSALRLLAYVEFSHFDDPRSVGCFAGLTPSRYESGTSIRRKETISRVGSRELRELLFFPAMVAMRHNPQMRIFAERLESRGKAPKVIICAVMRKLLVLAATLIRKQEFYDPAKGLATV